jgi:hypothetical protein
MNVIEALAGFTYIYLAHVARSPAAPLIGFMGATMTLAKTTLYFAQEIFCGGCSIGHNDLQTMISFWIIPNSCVFHIKVF